MLVEVKKCHACREVGQFARKCKKIKMDRGGKKIEDKPVKWYNYGKNGHMSMSCQSKALLCGDGLLGRVT